MMISKCLNCQKRIRIPKEIRYYSESWKNYFCTQGCAARYAVKVLDAGLVKVTK